MGRKKYTREDAKCDLLMSPFGESFGWTKETGKGKILTRMGRLVVNQYPSGKLKKVV